MQLTARCRLRYRSRASRFAARQNTQQMTPRTANEPPITTAMNSESTRSPLFAITSIRVRETNPNASGLRDDLIAAGSALSGDADRVAGLADRAAVLTVDDFEDQEAAVFLVPLVAQEEVAVERIAADVVDDPAFPGLHVDGGCSLPGPVVLPGLDVERPGAAGLRAA